MASHGILFRNIKKHQESSRPIWCPLSPKLHLSDQIPMLGPLGDLPLHPGGNSATLVARKLSDDEPVLLMR